MQGKLVCISGASAGIGLECARAFARVGANLVLGARRLDRLKEIASELSAAGVKVLPLALDVTAADSVTKFANLLREKFGSDPDIVINNAGLACGVDHLVDGQEADWQTMLDTNVMGLLRFTKAFLPAMKQRGTGHIINLGSIAGFQTYPGGAVYAGTKHAVKAINDALRMELLGTKIRVTSLDPGLVETEFSQVRLGDKGKAKQVYQGIEPLTGKDVAEVALFAASQPAHVNLDHIIMTPVAQASAYHVHRD